MIRDDMEGGVIENSGDNLDRSEDEAALESCCSPKKMPYRFLGLALMCLLGFGTQLTRARETRRCSRTASPVIVYLLPRHAAPRRNGVTVKEIAMNNRTRRIHCHVPRFRDFYSRQKCILFQSQISPILFASTLIDSYQYHV